MYKHSVRIQGPILTAQLGSERKWEARNLQIKLFSHKVSTPYESRLIQIRTAQTNFCQKGYSYRVSNPGRYVLSVSLLFHTFTNPIYRKRNWSLTRRLRSSSTVFNSCENSLNDWAETQRKYHLRIILKMKYTDASFWYVTLYICRCQCRYLGHFLDYYITLVIVGMICKVTWGCSKPHSTSYWKSKNRYRHALNVNVF